jgi:two-component system, NtrC family, response regulator HydG
MAIPEDLGSSATLEIEVSARAHDWVIEAQDDSGARRIQLSQATVVVGSSERQADIVLKDPTVSSRHCVLRVLGSGIAIEDLESKNGTFVGNARVKEAWGSAGTVIALGRSTLVLSPTPRIEGREEPGPPLRGIAGVSLVMRKLADQVRRLARYSEPVLVCGESGTGKELIARALHREGPRADKPFVVINVASLPRELVESELFGHERGAFTGAVSKRLGAFREADGGTLFLDEIGELPLEAQPKLLRALDGYEVRAVGVAGSGARADVRVVAATHVTLEREVTEHRFRLDLFHRLEAFVINVPPLRARGGDVGAIARNLLAGLTGNFGRRDLTPDAVARLAVHDWPGNVRELRNVLLRACDESEEVIDSEHIDRVLGERRARNVVKAPTVEEAEEMLVRRGGNVSAAARACGLPRSTFRKLLESGRTKR